MFSCPREFACGIALAARIPPTRRRSTPSPQPSPARVARRPSGVKGGQHRESGHSMCYPSVSHYQPFCTACRDAACHRVTPPLRRGQGGGRAGSSSAASENDTPPELLRSMTIHFNLRTVAGTCISDVREGGRVAGVSPVHCVAPRESRAEWRTPYPARSAELSLMVAQEAT